MSARATSFVRSAPASFSYLALLTATSAVLAVTSDRLHDRLLLAVSTNLHELGRAPLRVLVASAFWLDDWREVVPWTVLILAVVLPVERRIGWRRTALVFAIGHVGATLLVAAGLWFGLRHGWVDPAVEHARDIGASYGFLAVVALAAYLLRPRLRVVYVALIAGGVSWLAATSGTFTDYGHLTAFAIGLACYPLASRGRYALRQRPNTSPPSVNPSPNVPSAKPPIAMPLRQGDSRCQRPSASSSSAVSRSPRRRLRSAPPARTPR
ncbi:MAG TPA: rhomboid-like protein [Gaiellaceae bacterium]|nr:rhomboid-like protein [Gaiellaceae bacterium]